MLLNRVVVGEGTTVQFADGMHLIFVAIFAIAKVFISSLLPGRAGKKQPRK